MDLKDNKLNEELKQLVDDSYSKDLKSALRSRHWCKFTADFAETLGKLIIFAGIILTFAAPIWKLDVLAYIGGGLGTLGLNVMHFSSYAMGESKERTMQVNKILEKMGLDTIPDITIDSTVVTNRDTTAEI